MKQTMSRALSLALVLAMLLSMAAPAFAQEPGEGAPPRSGAASAENATADSAPVEKPDSAPAEDAPGASAEDAPDAPESGAAQEDAPSAPTSAANSTPAEDTPSAPDGETPDTPDPAQPLADAADALPAPLAETDAEGFIKGTEEGSDYWWKWDEATGTLTVKGTKMADWEVFPGSPWQEQKDKIQRVTIREGITNIGTYAFSGCTNLTGVDIPESATTIGRFSFENCASLTSVTIPAGVVQIHENVFSRGTGLREIVVAAENPNYCSVDGILYNKEKTDLLQAPAKIAGTFSIPDGVVNIGCGAFCGCSGLTGVTFPASLITIDMQAFSDCTGLTSVELPEGMLAIGYEAFAGCSGLTRITIPASTTSIDAKAFARCSALRELTLAKENASYRFVDGALYNAEKTELVLVLCTAAQGTFTVPDGVTTIGACAFGECTGLTGVNIPRSVTRIDMLAFEHCTGLISAALPEGLTHLDNIFWGCTALEHVTIPDGVTSIGDNAFDSCTSLMDVTLPKNLTTIGEFAFYGCRSLTDMEIPDRVTSIGDSAFALCTDLARVTLGKGVQDIGVRAFEDCVLLSSIVFSGNAPQIAADAFGHYDYSAAGIATAYYPQDNATWTAEKRQNYGGKLTWEAYDPANPPADDGFIKGTEIGAEYLWKLDAATGTLTIKGAKMPDWTPERTPWNSQRDAIRSVVIERGVTNIGSYAFYECEKITAVTLPAGLTEIGKNAFFACRGLTSVSIPDGVTKIGADAFMNCTGLLELELPESATNIGTRAFSACPLKEITLPSGMTEISDRLFLSCSGLRSIAIPAGVTRVGISAFHNCTGLQKVLFTGDAPAFLGTGEIRVFSGVTATAYYPRNNTTWTEEKRQNYGGTLTWVAYDPANPPDLDAPDAVTPTPESPYQTETFGTGENSVDMLSHVAPGTTLTALKANLENGAALVVKDASGKVLGEGAPVGTGCTVGFGEDGETGKVVVMIDGDVDGNGKITMLDVVGMRQSILRIKSLRGAYLRAAMPVTQTGSGPKLNDVTRVRQYLLRIVSSVAK